MDGPRICNRCGGAVENDDPHCLGCGAHRPTDGWTSDERIGQVMLGSLVVKRRIGSGAGGTVYLAEHRESGDRIAVKLLRPDLTSDPEILRRFRLEAVLTKSLGIPQVVQTYDFGQLEDGTHYFTMEYVEGEGLDRALARRHTLPLLEVIEIARQILSALSVAHNRGVMHRDLKPGNLILAQDAEGRLLVKILDFGFARVTAEVPRDVRRLTQGMVIMGTPTYMSPEQARGSRAVDGRSDLYSLGVILYRCLTGEAPFKGPSTGAVLQKQQDEAPKPPSTHRADLPADVDRIVLRLLEKDPARRHQVADDVLRDLDACFPNASAPADLQAFASRAANRSELIRQVNRHVMGTGSLPALTEPGCIQVRKTLLWVAGGILLVAVAGLVAWLLSRR